MNFISSIRTRFVSLLAWIGIVSKAQTLVNTFPGMDDQDKLRLWIIANADNFQPVVDRTPNKIDDMALDALRRVVLNERVFSVIFRLMQQAYEWIPTTGKEPIYGTGFKDFAVLLESDEPVENPILIISTVGLLIQIVMFIKSQRGR